MYKACCGLDGTKWFSEHCGKFCIMGLCCVNAMLISPALYQDLRARSIHWLLFYFLVVSFRPTIKADHKQEFESIYYFNVL